MIITLLNDTFTWCGIRWDVHIVAESTTCTIRVFKSVLQTLSSHEPSSAVAYVRGAACFTWDGRPRFPMKRSEKSSNVVLIMPS